MGIATGSMLIVGLEANALPEALLQRCRDEDYYEVLSEDGELGLACASPWFDADWDDRIWGIEIVGAYRSYSEVPDDLMERIAAAKELFKKKVGAEAKVYVSADIN